MHNFYFLESKNISLNLLETFIKRTAIWDHAILTCAEIQRKMNQSN
jgi:hypothetical protein